MARRKPQPAPNNTPLFQIAIVLLLILVGRTAIARGWRAGGVAAFACFAAVVAGHVIFLTFRSRVMGRLTAEDIARIAATRARR